MKQARDRRFVVFIIQGFSVNANETRLDDQRLISSKIFAARYPMLQENPTSVQIDSNARDV
jgi:hypothetical protein